MADRKNQGSNTRVIIEQIKKMPALTKEYLKPDDYAVPGGWADLIAKENKKVKTAQLRKFFNAIKKLHHDTRGSKNTDEVKIDEVKKGIINLIPQLVFARGREVLTADFYNLLEACLLKNNEGKKKAIRLSSYEEFENFVSFLEAIVAYHKANTKGGEDG